MWAGEIQEDEHLMKPLAADKATLEKDLARYKEDIVEEVKFWPHPRTSAVHPILDPA